MEIKVERKWYTDTSTIGELTVKGSDFQCFTLEDKVRPDGVKVYGETAIPAGTYKVVITMSPHFHKRMPMLLDVPMFTGIRIHSGNKAEDTSGCILVGTTRHKDWIGASRNAYNKLFAMMEGESEITIEIIDMPIEDYRGEKDE